MPEKKSHSFSVFINHEYPAIERGEGIYLYDTDGNRYIDASSGPITCSLGHGVKEIADTITYFSSPLSSATNGAVIKVDGGSMGGIL